MRTKYAEYFVCATPENLRAFAPTIGRIGCYLLASHESYHLGQLMQFEARGGLQKEREFLNRRVDLLPVQSTNW